MKVLFLSAIVLLSTACRGGQAPQPQEGGEDTLQKPVPLEQLFLPDTMYVSAQKVYFAVEQEDSLDHYLADVDDRYEADWSSFTFRRNMRCIRRGDSGKEAGYRGDSLAVQHSGR